MGARPGRRGGHLGWLLGELGWEPFQHWDAGRSWRYGDTYLVIEASPALSAPAHDRRAPGLNHLAFHAGPPPPWTGWSSRRRAMGGH